jgi:hypothetical protein
MDHISIKNIFASNAPRLPIYQKCENYQFAFVFIEGNLDIGSVRIENIGRNEELGDIETVRICENTKIKTLVLEHVSHINRTGKPVPVITNEGEINKLYMIDIDGGDDTVLNNKGTIHTLKEI